MLFERITSPGIAHHSYLIGEGGQACVIDPRRDGEIYMNLATQAGMRITTILETHRNEDYITGSRDLAARSGAAIWHADEQLDYDTTYGQPAEDGQTWRLGGLTIEAIHSPGHTSGSMSYLLREPGGAPWMLFSGDALFAGDVGRVDFLGMDQAPRMAGLLYETIFEKFLPLGDHVLLCPAHGHGSACGGAIADRTWTTLGLERQLNPRLQATSREDFIDQVTRQLEKPPYFSRMEAWNLGSAPPLDRLPTPPPLSPPEFEAHMADAVVLDTRQELGFTSAHVPGALSIWADGVPRFAGWFLPLDERPLLLVLPDNNPEPIVRVLVRIGYDNIAGFLAGGMLAWHMSGRASARIKTITVQDLCHALDEGAEPWILDVRSAAEVANGPIPDAHHIHITQIPQNLEHIPAEQPIYVFCGSGMRSTIAASLLVREGRSDVTLVLGGLAGWHSHACPLEL